MKVPFEQCQNAMGGNLPAKKKIDWTKPIRTVEGHREARVLATDAGGSLPVVVAVQSVFDPKQWLIQRCSEDGSMVRCFETVEHPVENVPEKRAISGWVNIYSDGDKYILGGSFHPTKEEAVRRGGSNAVARKFVSLDFEIGEGLD